MDVDKVVVEVESLLTICRETSQLGMSMWDSEVSKTYVDGEGLSLHMEDCQDNHEYQKHAFRDRCGCPRVSGAIGEMLLFGRRRVSKSGT